MSSGALGTLTNPGFVDEGTSALTHHRAPGALGPPSATQIEQYAAQAARRVMTALDGIDTRDAIGSFLGSQSFTAGVVVGMAQNLVDGAASVVKLFKTLALAEYWESQHAHGFWDRFSHASWGLTPLGGAMVIASMFWPDFDHQARLAHEEREVLFKMVRHAFEHPGEVFSSLVDEQKKKYEEFKQYLDRHTMAGDFRAGRLFGELLLDVLLVADGLAALAKLATKVPGLLKLLPRLEELVPVLRRAPKVSGVVKEAETVRAARPTGGRVYDAINPTGTGTRNGTRAIQVRDTRLNAKSSAAINEAVVSGPFGKVPSQITTSSGYVIEAKADATTTILGRWNVDMKSIINSDLGYPRTSDFGPKVGGYNVLNVETELSGDQFWVTYNKPFLDNAMARGDDVVLATVPKAQTDLIAFDGTPSGMFGREVEYLVKCDYKPANLGEEEWQLMKSWFNHD